MSWIRDIFAAIRPWVTDAFGVTAAVYQRVDVNYAGNVTVVDNGSKQRTDITIGQNPNAALVGSSLTVTGDTDAVLGAGLQLDGTITNGPDANTVGVTTTVGSASSVLLTLPIPANQIRTFLFRTSADRPTTVGGYVVQSAADQRFSGITNGGGGSAPSQACSMGLSPSQSAQWAGGVLTVTVHGPSATVTGSASGTAGVVRLTVSGGAGLDSTLTGQKVDVSGVGGTTEANGTNITATFVDATHLELAGTTWANAWTSGGTVVFHTPPTLSWRGRAEVV